MTLYNESRFRIMLQPIMTAMQKTVRDYLAAIGRKGGQIGGKVRSPAKLEAARENGKKGGRPKKNGNGNKKGAKR